MLLTLVGHAASADIHASARRFLSAPAPILSYCFFGRFTGPLEYRIRLSEESFTSGCRYENKAEEVINNQLPVISYDLKTAETYLKVTSR